VKNEANEAVVRRVFDELVNRAVYDEVATIYAADYIDHAPLPGGPAGIDGVEYSIGGLQTAMPDLQVTIEDISSSGDKVAAHNTWRGTHLGEILGIQPTGRRLSFGGVVIFRLVDFAIVERWAVGMELDLLKELGLDLKWGRSRGVRQ
jgi:predicted ester cyclase